MSDEAVFREMVANAKQRQQERIEVEQRKKAEEEARRSKSENWLSTIVLPLLQVAKKAVAAADITLNITHNLQDKNLGDRWFCFQCVGPAKKNAAGGVSQRQSRKFYVLADGDTFTLAAGSSDYSNHPDQKEPKAPTEASDVPDRLREHIRSCIDDFFVRD